MLEAENGFAGLRVRVSQLSAFVNQAAGMDKKDELATCSAFSRAHGLVKNGQLIALVEGG